MENRVTSLSLFFQVFFRMSQDAIIDVFSSKLVRNLSPVRRSYISGVYLEYNKFWKQMSRQGLGYQIDEYCDCVDELDQWVLSFKDFIGDRLTQYSELDKEFLTKFLYFKIVFQTAKKCFEEEYNIKNYKIFTNITNAIELVFGEKEIEFDNDSFPADEVSVRFKPVMDKIHNILNEKGYLS